jgi:ABC-2 type transport system ATP-binding protein
MIARELPGLIGSLSEGGLAVETRGLVKRFRKVPALDGMDLSVPEESVYILVGPNGAGKTTTLRIIMDLLRADAGACSLFGLSPKDQGPEVRARIGYVPDTRYEGCRHMTVREMLDHHREYYPNWDRSYAAKLVSTLDLQMDGLYGSLSKGEARRVQLVQALAHRPSLLLLDEPTDGLDPLARDVVLGLLSDHLADSKTTLLLSTHHVQEVEGLADCMGVLRKGRLVAQLRRETLDTNLRRYRATVPADWTASPEIQSRTLQCVSGAREIAWTIWGDPTEIAHQLSACGAELRQTETLDLEDAARVLLAAEDRG